ncbi:transketolase (plasmid) [Streptomyces sp. Qhu-G9]|uniref:transketolase n=1 Tax=Streptomyces sp. Qhu-G9 TaxID=3452799 RepID=UPI0022ABCF31|nr:transketolase [Streptomyces aurantiacus]WAU78284.1 transketolase [Streptomyces aurantiacus]
MTDTENDVTDLRHRVLKLIAAAGSGHPGSSLSCLHILQVLYRQVLRGIREQDEQRDRFLLSKGHAAPALYVCLEEQGLFPEDGDRRLREPDSILQGHPDRLRTPGVEASSGSLGQGLSQAVGLALGMRLRDNPAHIYVLLGDGELQEGQVWEAAAAASHYNLRNITAIVDRNRHQHDGPTEAVMALEPLADRWRAFGWHVQEIDGHDGPSIKTAALARPCGPSVVIAHTHKGHGVPFMEGDSPWHSVRDADLLRRYVRQLDTKGED